MKNEIIESALHKAKSSGLAIIAYGIFDWTYPSVIIGDTTPAVDPFGAVIWSKGQASGFKENFPKGWLAQLCKDIGQDAWWISRFSMGFTNIFPMNVDISKDNNPIWKADEVAAYGIELRKVWVR